MTAYPHSRARPRYRFQLPVVVSGDPSAAGPHGVTRDISEIGVFFYADFWPAAMHSFEFRTIMPPEITHGEARRALCRANVVRIEEMRSKIGVAARIEEIIWM